MRDSRLAAGKIPCIALIHILCILAQNYNNYMEDFLY